MISFCFRCIIPFRITGFIIAIYALEFLCFHISEETCDPRKQRFEGYGLTTGKDGSHRLTG